MSAKKSVLIVGGGVAGVFCAKECKDGGLNVTLVDRKEFCDVPYANVRYSVKPGAVAGNHIPYKEIPGIGTFKQGSVTQLTKTTATLDGGDTITFDYLVICTGSKNGAGVWAQPQGTTIAERNAEAQGTSDQIAAAKQIVIVGGGPVGIEIAAEIVEAYAGKSITLVHAGSKLLEGKKSAGESAAAWLKENKVAVEYNMRAEEKDGGVTLTPKSGGEAKVLDADLVIWAIGSKPNTSWLADTEFASALNDKGQIAVDLDFRVKGFQTVFALGDVTDIPEEKLGFLSMMHGKMAGKNLSMLARSGSDSTTLGKWKPGGPMSAMFVSLGKKAGSGFMCCCSCPSMCVAGMKSKDLFVGQFRSNIGVKAVTQPTDSAANRA